jgi:hypothetical protein
LPQQSFVQKKTATITTNGHSTPGPAKQKVHWLNAIQSFHNCICANSANSKDYMTTAKSYSKSTYNLRAASTPKKSQIHPAIIRKRK